MKMLPIVRRVSGSNRHPESLVTEIVAHAKVDDEYFDELNRYRWIWNSNDPTNRYPARSGPKRRTVLLHLEVARLANLAKLEVVDHKDNDVLNAQKSNLRPTTRSGNFANSKLARDSTTGFKGATRHKGKYYVQVYAHGRRVYAEYFIDLLEAAMTYDEEIKALFGDLAKTNKSLGLY
jgi:hypothetical protein